MSVFSLLGGIFYNYYDFFNSIGYFGEYITFIITCALIYNQYIYLIIFIIMFVLNKVINQYLKKIFHQNRPSNPVKFLDSDKFTKKKYGMPSGHSQNAFFSIVYAYLVTRSFIPWTLTLLVVGLIVIYERLKYKNHTINQLIAGAAVGSFIGYLTYSFANLIMRVI